ncbi:MAG: hypothetical protein U0P45_12130 [Acidimicrobiales bacterium]
MDRSAPRTSSRARRGRTARAVAVGAVALLVVLTGCSKSDDSSSDTTTTAKATTTEATTTTTEATTAATGTPEFTSFEVKSPVPCQDGNATVHMAFTTENVQQMAVSVDGGEFAGTAGYGPNETDVVVSLPCGGAGTGTVQLQGCNAANECAESTKETVEITAS